MSWVCTDWPLVDRGLTLLLVETAILELICTTLASLGTVTPWAGLGVFWFWALIFFLFLIFNIFFGSYRCEDDNDDTYGPAGRAREGAMAAAARTNAMDTLI